MAIKVSKAVKEMRIRLSTKAASCVTAIIASQKMAGEIVPKMAHIAAFRIADEIESHRDGKEERKEEATKSVQPVFFGTEKRWSKSHRLRPVKNRL